jgi:probable rRNA maturation factor
MTGLSLRNRQRTRRVHLPLLRRIARWLLEEGVRAGAYDVAVCLVESAEMAALNERHLGHSGSTDVLTFDYSEAGDPAGLRGEIVISVPDAVRQAPGFRATWPSEAVRYLVHGILHLAGHDDRQPRARRAMKRAEDRLLREVARRFALSKLSRNPRVQP